MSTSGIDEALAAAVSAIYFSDSSDYKTALWKVVTALGGKEAAELLEIDESAAYDKYGKKASTPFFAATFK